MPGMELPQRSVSVPASHTAVLHATQYNLGGLTEWLDCSDQPFMFTPKPRIDGKFHAHAKGATPQLSQYCRWQFLLFELLSPAMHVLQMHNLLWDQTLLLIWPHSLYASQENQHPLNWSLCNTKTGLTSHKASR